MTNERNAPIEMAPETFRQIGHRLVDAIAGFMEKLEAGPITPGESPQQLQQLLGNESLPESGKNAEDLVLSTAQLLFDHSLFNGHPKFFGYITGAPAPIGALADLLAAAVNANVGAQVLSPIATEIEKQTVRWLAEFIGVPPTVGGILVSGGNMANFTGFLAGRTAKAPKQIKQEGIYASIPRLRVYCSKATHTWVEKAVVFFGLGLNALNWIDTDADNRIDPQALEAAIQEDLAIGNQPMMIIGTAGDVSTGAVDDFTALAELSKRYNCWFHIDGAYGIPAAVLPNLQAQFAGIGEADSIALDPHKWLYSPLEAGCALVKDPNHLVETYSSHPVYYNFENSAEGKPQNFYEYGFQNSRGFRALKVWLMLQQVGRNGYIEMISEDCELAKKMYALAEGHEELEAMTQHLSITTMRYIPTDISATGSGEVSYLDQLNEALVNNLQKGGELFLSNAVVRGKYCLRACIVNFRTSAKDIEEMIGIIVREGRVLHLQLNAARLATASTL
ncbi:MAG: pyridoxal-dependent decarboxylase [Bacteroidota bacterium]